MALNVEAFYDAINNIAQQQVQASPSDLTIDAELVYISDITVGKYKVEYQGNTFTAFSTDPTVTYKVGERVYVLVPQGDFSSKKVILGRSAYNNNLTHGDIQDMTNFYIDQGPNWVDKNQKTYDLTRGMVEDDWTNEDPAKISNRLQLCVIPEEDKSQLTHLPANYCDEGFRRFPVPAAEQAQNTKNRYPKSYMSEKELEVVDTSFRNYAKRYSWLKIKADFLTQFNAVHNSGEYRLKVIFLADNPKYAEEGTEKYSKNGPQEKYIFVTFYLGFKEFNGSQYSQVVPTPQKGYYQINPGELKGLYSVQLEQDGKFVCDYMQHYDENTGDLQWLPENKVTDTNNVFVSNIDIRFCKKINLMDTLYYVWIEQPLGEAVYDPDDQGNSGRDSVLLVPHMAYGQQEVSKDCRFIWYREDLTIPNEHEPNKDDRDDDGKTYFDYGGPGWRPIEHFIEDEHDGYKLNEDGSLRVYKSEVPWQWRFKLVGIYSTDDKNTYGEDIAFVKNRDSKYDLDIQAFTDKGSNEKLLRITDNNRKVGEMINPSTNRPYPEWFGDWYYQLADNSWNTIIPQYYHGPLPINEYSAYEHITFRVAAYDPTQVAPETGEWVEGQPRTLVDPIGILSYEVNVSTDLDLLIEWEGQSTFNYTALGKAYSSVSEKEYQLAPKINWVHGESLAYDVQIFAPDGAPLGTRTFYNPDNKDASVLGASGQGYDPPGSMMYAMYQDVNNVLHFKVKQEFDADCILNTVNVEVHTIQDDKWYEKPLEVMFTKDGQQGTQGTGWCAPLRLTNHDRLRKQVWDRKAKKYEFKEVAQAFTTPLGLPTMPIILRREGNNYVQTNKTKVVIRPFVTKDGKKLESLAESGSDSTHYRIKAYYDVRFPQNAKDSTVANSSFLRICDPISGVPLSEFGSVGRPKANPDGAPGLFAMTLWDGSDKTKPQNATYNAVQIKYEPRAGIGITHEQVCNQFIVRCQIDIETDLPTTVRRKTGAGIGDYEVGAGQGWHRIKSINSWYPIDIFIEDEDNTVDFNPNFVSINWPQSIAYDSRGYNPVIDSDYLEFYYAYFPDAGVKDDAKFIIPEVPEQNQSVQTVENNPNPILGQNVKTEQELNDLNEEDSNRQWSDMEEEVRAEAQYKTLVSRVPEFIYKLKPKAHLNWQEGTVGALVGVLDGQEVNGTPMPKGKFIRNQIYYLNAYENVDINSWDGQGIDINEDNGTIFAPTIGAGFKGPLTNKFTGVLMGVNTGFLRKTSGITQYTDIADRELQEYPYMTGLFGYQCGYSSFALLENGTAFFGRKDRGGRIIIDGYNATIYGGANGELNSPKIGDPMWNSMRLTMVDLSHATAEYEGEENDGGILENPEDGDSTTEGRDAATAGNMQGNQKPTTTEVQGIKQGFDGAYFGMGKDAFADDRYRVKGLLPPWYQRIWENAYIKPRGALPWWLEDPDTKYDEKIQQILDPYRGQQYEYLDANYYIDYWHPNLEEIRQGWTAIEQEGEESGCLNLTGFGPSRASTTPAIEIGQHPPGLMPGLLDWGTYEEVFRELYIPGDRNFMVTYDGTLWAMNGVFMGNVIGSNILGGRIQGAELGIGKPQKIDWSKVKVIDKLCDWDQLQMPKSRTLTIEEQKTANGAFSVDSDGNVICKNISIYGGSIDLGTFHIIGTEGSANDEYGGPEGKGIGGTLIQFGESDFVGPVHCFGNLGIGPGLNQTDEDAPYGFQFSKQGNLFQTYGLAALGIILPQQDCSFHSQFAQSDDWMDIGSLRYKGEGSAGDPGIGDSTSSIEQMAFFAIDSRFGEDLAGGRSRASRGSKMTDVVGYQGHMWPMAFKYIDVDISSDEDSPTKAEGVHAYLTTMDIFKSKSFKISTGVSSSESGGSETIPEGSNYFRVGPWGQEGFRYYICQSWQSENKSEQPTVTRGGEYTPRGFMGLVDRAGYGDGRSASLAIGMTSWGSAPIIFTSDENTSIRTRQGMYLLGSNVDTAKYDVDLLVTQKQGPGFRSAAYIGGGSDESSHISFANLCVAQSGAGAGYLSFEAVEGDKAAPVSFGIKDGKRLGGIYIDPQKVFQDYKGAWLYGKKETDIHIVMGDQDNIPTVTEIYLYKQGIRGNASDGIWFSLNNEPHYPMNGGSGAQTDKGGHTDLGAFGMDKGSAGMYHPKRVAFTSGVPQDTWSKTISEGGGGMGLLLEGKDNTCWGYDAGYLKIEHNKLIAMGELAVPDNQYCIYARFG